MAVNAKLDIKVGMQIRRRLDAERFRPSITRTSTWHRETNLDTYGPVLSSMTAEVWTEAQSIRAVNDDLHIHASVRMDNPTHTTSIGAGVVPLAKNHYDLALTNEEFASASSLQVLINDAIVKMRGYSEY